VTLAARAATVPPLWAGEIHVWELARGESLDLSELAGVLRVEECDRARRLRREEDRWAAVVSRGAARILLARYGSGLPGDLVLVLGPQGKPRLADGSPLRFNVSHSDGLVLVALSRDAEVGVDVERVREVPSMDTVVGHFFGEAERECFDGLPPGGQLEGFFQAWVRKEAVVKARGDGLAAVADVDVREDAGGGLRCGRWHVADLAVRDGYCAAVAADRPAIVRVWS
jgi:4'-phosphopantetheinyl transferase